MGVAPEIGEGEKKGARDHHGRARSMASEKSVRVLFYIMGFVRHLSKKEQEKEKVNK